MPGADRQKSKTAAGSRHLPLFAAVCLAAVLICAPQVWAGPRDDLRAGYACIKLNDLHTAITRLNKAIAGAKQLSLDDLFLAFVLRGDAHQDLREYSQAMEDYDQALKTLGKDVTAHELATIYAKKGTIYQAKGDHQTALAFYDRALKQEPHNAEALRLKAEIWRFQRNYPKSLIYLNRSIASAPSHQAYYDRSLVYERLGDYQKAYQDIKTALSLSPHRRAYRSRLAYMEDKVKD